MEQVYLIRNEMSLIVVHTFVGFKPRGGHQGDEVALNESVP